MKKKYWMVIGAVLLLLYHEAVLGSAKVVFDRGNQSFVQANIPEGGVEYFEEDYLSLLQCTIGDPDLGRIDEKDIPNIRFCDPYIVYVSSGEQDPIYYFPVYLNHEIYFVYELIPCDSGYSLGISDNMVDVLNEVDYIHQETLFYEYHGEIIAENGKGKKKTGYPLSTVEANDSEEESFYQLSFPQKREKIEQRAEFLKTLQEDTAAITNLAGSQRRGKGLSLHIPQGQYHYEMCWASTVATIVNFKNNSSITGFEVCNRMGIGYNEGGDIRVMQDALSRYGVKYNYIKKEMLSWNKIKNNIDWGYPVAVVATTGGGYKRHAVVVIGYKIENHKKRVRLWDPYLNKQKGGYQFKDYAPGIVAHIGTSNYYWSQSLTRFK